MADSQGISPNTQYAIQMGFRSMDAFATQSYQSGNARVMERNARTARVTGEMQEADFRRGAARAVGTQRAALAANGVDITSGSALDFAADQAFEVEREAYGINMQAEMQARSFEAQARQLRKQAEKAKRMGVLQAGVAIGAAFFTGGASLALIGAGTAAASSRL